MVRYDINDVNDRMILGQAITLPNGKMLLNAGYKVSNDYKKRLKEIGYTSLLIAEEGTEEAIPEELVDSHKIRQLDTEMKQTKKNAAKIMNQFRPESGKSMKDFLKTKRRDLERFVVNPVKMRIVDNIIDEVLSEPNTVLNLQSTKETDEDSFKHAINVAITAIAIGKKYNYFYDEIKQLTLGALNANIGMVALPKKFLMKKSGFTQDEIDEHKKHTTYGYLMLSACSQMPATSAIVALQHHEFQNGTGYPSGIKGNNRAPLKDLTQRNVIHRFAEIVTVADMYHNIVRDGLEERELIQDTLSKMVRLAGPILNSEIVKTLLDIVPVYPIGTRVRITSCSEARFKRYIGVVSKDNPRDLARPNIILYKTFAEKLLEKPISIDTARYRDLEFQLLI